jgi:DNA-binding NtrC family response regulator
MKNMQPETQKKLHRVLGDLQARRRGGISPARV